MLPEESCPCQSIHAFKGRLCERQLVRRGIGLYITTKRTFIKPMIYRAIALANALAAQGCQVIEVYPFASKVCLFGRPIPPKSRKAGLDFLRRNLAGLVPGLADYDGRLDHDLCDALVAAYTACLHSQGRTEALGLPEEVPIVVPSLPL